MTFSSRLAPVRKFLPALVTSVTCLSFSVWYYQTQAFTPHAMPNEEQRAYTFDALALQTHASDNVDHIPALQQRLRLLSFAHGQTLEVAAGTGMNLSLYPTNVTHLTMLDASAAMIQKAQETYLHLVDLYIRLEKAEKEEEEEGHDDTRHSFTISQYNSTFDAPSCSSRPLSARLLSSLPCQSVLRAWTGSPRALHIPAPDSLGFVVGRAEALPFPADMFDTVVDVGGLCSFHDPVQALREMARVLKKRPPPLPPTHTTHATHSAHVTATTAAGKILLLEHGLPSHPLLAWIVSRQTLEHARQAGCLLNRDIEQLVQQAGLQVIHREVFSWGRERLLVCQPIDTDHHST